MCMPVLRDQIKIVVLSWNYMYLLCYIILMSSAQTPLQNRGVWPPRRAVKRLVSCLFLAGHIRNLPVHGKGT